MNIKHHPLVTVSPDNVPPCVTTSRCRNTYILASRSLRYQDFFFPKGRGFGTFTRHSFTLLQYLLDPLHGIRAYNVPLNIMVFPADKTDAMVKSSTLPELRQYIVLMPRYVYVMPVIQFSLVKKRRKPQETGCST